MKLIFREQNERLAQLFYEKTHQQMLSVVPWLSLDERQKRSYRLAVDELASEEFEMNVPGQVRRPVRSSGVDEQRPVRTGTYPSSS